MAKEFQLEIVTPERVVYADKAVSISARAVDGRIGILQDHRPLVTQLKISPFTFKQSNGDIKHVAISGSGYLEATPLKVVVLCETAELAEEIDIERAKNAKERAKERLNRNDESIDYVRAEASLKRAMARIQTTKKEDEED